MKHYIITLATFFVFSALCFAKTIESNGLVAICGDGGSWSSISGSKEGWHPNALYLNNAEGKQLDQETYETNEECKMRADFLNLQIQTAQLNKSKIKITKSINTILIEDSSDAGQLLKAVAGRIESKYNRLRIENESSLAALAKCKKTVPATQEENQAKTH